VKPPGRSGQVSWGGGILLLSEKSAMRWGSGDKTGFISNMGKLNRTIIPQERKGSGRESPRSRSYSKKRRGPGATWINHLQKKQVGYQRKRGERFIPFISLRSRYTSRSLWEEMKGETNEKRGGSQDLADFTPKKRRSNHAHHSLPKDRMRVGSKNEGHGANRRRRAIKKKGGV